MLNDFLEKSLLRSVGNLRPAGVPAILEDAPDRDAFDTYEAAGRHSWRRAGILLSGTGQASKPVCKACAGVSSREL